MAIEDHWPFFGLRVRTPRLELRVVDDELGAQLGELANRGVHDPASTPFAIPWTDAPADELPRNALQHYWLCRAQLRPESWHLSLAALHDGEVIGAGSVIAEQFPRVRTFETGSWMGEAFQRRGFGLEFRHACLHLGFAGLGGERATTGAWHDNAGSLGVTARLPYVPNGELVQLRRETADLTYRFVMSRDAWETVRRDDISIEGLEPCLPLLGL